MEQAALGDITVVDFSQAISAPYASALLADLGAEVINVEPPSGGSQREFIKGIAHDNVSRNKQSIVLNIKTEQGREIAHRLIRSSDVFLHNYRPGTSFVGELGFDYESIKAITDDIIYCSVTGFGETGPYSERPGFDPLAQAMSGLMTVTGEPDRKPSRVGTSAIDWCTGVYAAFAIVAAIRHRDRTGEGQKIETSLFDTAAALMAQWYTYYSRTGKQIERRGHSWEAYSPVGVFNTMDQPIYISVPFQGLWERFSKTLEHEEWLNDPRFETNEDRIENQDTLHEKIEKVTEEYPRDELVSVLLDSGIPVSEVQSVAEASQDEHLLERGTIKPVANPEREDEVLITDIPIKFSTMPTVTRRAPTLGEHSRDILASLGLDSEEIDDLMANGVVHGE